MEKIEYFVELKDGWLWWIFFGVNGWMDVGGVWGEGKRGGVVVDRIFGEGKGWGLGCGIGW